MTTEQDFDHAIDAVARDLTAGDPPTHLRARVLARLDERPARRPVWLMAVACAVVVVAALVLTHRHPQDLPVAHETQARQTKPVEHEAQPDRASVADQQVVPVADAQPDRRTRKPAVRATAPSAE